VQRIRHIPFSQHLVSWSSTLVRAEVIACVEFCSSRFCAAPRSPRSRSANVTIGGNVTVVGGGGGGATFAQGWTAINGGTSFEAANVAVNVAAGAWAKTITGGTSCDATNGNAKEIFYTYSGGWIDTVNQYVALHGGGHNGYGGNEVYVMHYP
jgi:hypothetical protein